MLGRGSEGNSDLLLFVVVAHSNKQPQHCALVVAQHSRYCFRCPLGCDIKATQLTSYGLNREQKVSVCSLSLLLAHTILDSFILHFVNLKRYRTHKHIIFRTLTNFFLSVLPGLLMILTSGISVVVHFILSFMQH